MSRSLVCSLTLLLAAGHALLPAESPERGAWAGEYQADRRSISESYDLPWSELLNERLDRNAAAWMARLDRAPFEALDRDGQADWLLLRNHLKKEAVSFARERRQLAEMEPLLPFRAPLQKLEAARLARTPLDPRQAAAEMAAQIKPVEALTQRLSEARKAVPPAVPVSPATALRAARVIADLRESLTRWFQFHDGYRPDFGWWVRQPWGRLSGALEACEKCLREDIAGQKGQPDDPLVGDPLGAEELAAEIAGEMLPETAEELIAAGEREFAWCEARLQEIAAEMKTTPAGVLEKVKAAQAAPGEQDQVVAAAAEQAIAFIEANHLVTIPPLCRETWRLKMIPPDLQKTLPYAVYSKPAVMVAFAADTMPHEDKLMAMRGNNRHFTRIVTAHELIPGHHLQGFAADRSRPWRSLFSTPFYVEGWALHWEMLLWDRGYAVSPEDRAGMLFWRLHRCARIIVSLKFHLGRMTPAQMIDFLVQRVGHEPMGATSEARRYINGSYGPLYQAGYMLGGLQFRALHRELTATGQWTDQSFHDAVLAQNTMPVALLRAVLTGAPLTRDWKSTWRFSGE